MRQTRLVGAELKIRYFCDYKPIGKKGEPLNDYVVMTIDIADLKPYEDPCRGDSGIVFYVKCPACRREHRFDLDTIQFHGNEGV